MKKPDEIRKKAEEWTAKDTYDYSMCYYPLFKHMSEEHGLTLLHQEMDEIMLAAKMVEQNLQNSFGHLAIMQSDSPPSQVGECKHTAIKKDGNKMVCIFCGEPRIINP